MSEPTHPLARVKDAALAWVRATPSAAFDDVWRLSMRINVNGLVDDIRLRPEDATEDLRFEIAEWSDPEVSRGQAVQILARVSDLDMARGALDTAAGKWPGKALILSDKGRVIDRRGPDAAAK